MYTLTMRFAQGLGVEAQGRLMGGVEPERAEDAEAPPLDGLPLVLEPGVHGRLRAFTGVYGAVNARV